MTQIEYKTPGRRPVKPDNKALAEFYSKHTAQEIADLYGVKRSTAKGWIRKASREEAEKEKQTIGEKKEAQTAKQDSAPAETVIARIPALIASPSTSKYKTALSFAIEDKENQSYLALLKDTAPTIQFAPGTNVALLDGTELNKTDPKGSITNDISDADITKLRILYSIIKRQYEEQMAKDIANGKINKYSVMGNKNTIYVPDLMKQMGITAYKSRKHINILVREILKYQKLIDRYAVLHWLGDSEADGTITIVQSYLNVLAYYTIRDGIQRDEYNKPIVKCDGKALIEATHCYLEKTNISKEKSIGAKEIVRVICQLLAETGQNGTPHISAATILSRCPVLESQLRNIVNKDGTPDTKHRNQHLKRVFRTVIRLLHTQTESKRFTKTSFFRIRTVWPSRLCKR